MVKILICYLTSKMTALKVLVVFISHRCGQEQLAVAFCR